MKHLRTLGLLAVAVAALMASAGTASASTLTSPEGTTYTSSIVATSTNSAFDGAFITVECGHSEAKGKIETHGVAGGQTINAGGKLSALTFSGCNYHTTVISEGTLHITGSNSVYSTGASIELESSVGHCVFTTNNTKVGTLFEGKNALVGISSAAIPKSTGSFLCGASATWTGSYDLTTPNDLWVD